MNDPELLGEVARWLRYARDDLKIAELILRHEQAIKASLIFLQIPFRKTHDLEILCQELPEGWTLGKEPRALLRPERLGRRASLPWRSAGGNGRGC